MAVVEYEVSTSKSIHGHGPDGACRYLGKQQSERKTREMKGEKVTGVQGPQVAEQYYHL
jgi:hypothetical protein